MSHGKLLKTADVQARIGVSKDTLYRWNYKRINLTARKIGGSLRYTESDLQKFIDDAGDNHGEGEGNVDSGRQE